MNAADVKKLQIPIPCPENPEKSLEIQAEIVRILDAFTELTAELTTRKKQYNYYRDQLLSFEFPSSGGVPEGRGGRDVEWKTLGEVAKFRRGTAITQKQTTAGDIPVVANGPTPTYLHGKSNREGETIVIARSGANAGYVSFWNQPIFLTDAFSVHPDSKILKSKFVYHFLQNKQEHIHTMKKGAGVPHVRVKEFELYDIPIPSLDEQARIVAILDKFDALTNSLTEGLPREIALRQKQYEYYRDLLLSFHHPALTGTPPEEGNNPACLPNERNNPALTDTRPEEGDNPAGLPNERNIPALTDTRPGEVNNPAGLPNERNNPALTDTRPGEGNNPAGFPNEKNNPALTGIPADKENIFAPQFPSSGGVPEGRGGKEGLA